MITVFEWDFKINIIDLLIQLGLTHGLQVFGNLKIKFVEKIEYKWVFSIEKLEI